MKNSNYSREGMVGQLELTILQLQSQVSRLVEAKNAIVEAPGQYVEVHLAETLAYTSTQFITLGNQLNNLRDYTLYPPAHGTGV